MGNVSFMGRVVRGKGTAVNFTGADWARRAFIDLVAIDPFPGTLNLRLDEPIAQAVWAQAQRSGGLLMAAPDPAWCDGRLWPVILPEGIAGAIVRPDVPGYAEDLVEIIAAVNLRQTLGLVDHALIEVELVAASARGG